MNENRFEQFNLKSMLQPTVHSMLRRSTDLSEQPKERRYRNYVSA